MSKQGIPFALGLRTVATGIVNLQSDSVDTRDASGTVHGTIDSLDSIGDTSGTVHGTVVLVGTGNVADLRGRVVIGTVDRVYLDRSKVSTEGVHRGVAIVG